jgi:type I restriction enzyme S subunit
MREDWKEARIDELGTGRRPVLKAGPFGSSVTKATYQASGYKVYGQQEVVAKDLSAEAYFISEATFSRHKSCAVKPGDLLMTMMGTIGRVYRVPEGAPEGIINPRLVRIAFDTSRILPEFAEVAFEQPPLQRLLNRRSHGGTMQGLNIEALASIRLLLPPIPEQRKIAEILRTWDTATQFTEQLTVAKERHYSHELSRLISRGQDPHGHDGTVAKEARNGAGKWQTVALSDIADRVQRQNDGGEYPLLTISSASGFIRQEDRYSRYMAGESAKTYTLLRAGEFSYNKGNSKRYEFGCVFQLQNHESALVPSVYVSFKLHDSVCASYMRHLFAADYLKPQLRALVKTGVRNNGLLNIRPDEFMGTKVPLPPVEQQLRIANYLDAASAEIDLLKQQLAALRIQKRGLMQKLLTGQWRLTLNPDGEST